MAVRDRKTTVSAETEAERKGNLNIGSRCCRRPTGKGYELIKENNTYPAVRNEVKKLKNLMT